MLTVAAIVFVITWLLYAVALKFFPVLKLLDFPERYGLARTRRLPYPTGIIAVIVFLCVIPVLFPIGMKEGGMMAAIALLGFACFFDDRTPLPSSVRLLVQVIVGILLFLTGSHIYTITNPLGGIIKLDSILLQTDLLGTLPILSGLFTVGWLLLTINALNWFDGVSGQVSVLSVIGFAMLGCLAFFRNGETDIALMAFTLAAIAAAGMTFDIPPARMLMGDTGAMFFGLMLGLLGIYHGGKVATAFLTLGMPLLDALFVIIRRILRKQSPFRGGQDHLHHCLLRRGWTERQIVLLTAIIGMAFGITALFLNTTEKGIAFVLLVVVMLLLRRYADSPTVRKSAERSAM